MKGEYIPSASARQQFERESEGRVAQLTAEVERLEALVDIDLAKKVNALRDALDHVVRATKYDEPHWSTNTPVDKEITDSMAKVSAGREFAESKPSFADDLPF
jgi:hypothetical protein